MPATVPVARTGHFIASLSTQLSLRRSMGTVLATRPLFCSSAECSPHGPRNYTTNETVGRFSAFSTIKRRYFSSPPSQHEELSTDYHHQKASKLDLSERSNHKEDKEADASAPPTLLLRDVRLPVAQHLDPDGSTLPTSDWIHINGTLPIGSLDQVLHSVELILREEDQKGIIDLDAEWNPVQDPQVPLVMLEGYVHTRRPHKPSMVEAAHVVLSPFGRPNGWHLKLTNRSLVYALLDRSRQQQIRIGWKLVTVQEYHYSKERHQQEDPAIAGNNGLVVDDTMVRIENCPPDMDSSFVRHFVTRYELAHHGNTVLKWKGETNDGKIAPLMFIVRFASASWARAAVRELQASVIHGKTIKLVQYPKQILYQDN